jgi:NAD-dependent SIR2 family protein deacetylase
MTSDTTEPPYGVWRCTTCNRKLHGSQLENRRCPCGGRVRPTCLTYGDLDIVPDKEQPL